MVRISVHRLKPGKTKAILLIGILCCWKKISVEKERATKNFSIPCPCILVMMRKIRYGSSTYYIILESYISTHPCSLFDILQNICFISYQLIMIHHISEYHKCLKWLFQLGIGSGNSHVPQYFWFQNFRLYNAAYFSICVPKIFTISVKHQRWTTCTLDRISIFCL